jgi:hypothetical protein
MIPQCLDGPDRSRKDLVSLTPNQMNVSGDLAGRIK